MEERLALLRFVPGYRTSTIPDLRKHVRDINGLPKCKIVYFGEHGFKPLP
jgi:hypothetical protein